jgi:hypothetical protein
MIRWLVLIAFVVACGSKSSGISPEQEQRIAERVRDLLRPELDAIRNQLGRAQPAPRSDPALDRVAQLVDDAARCVAGGDDTNVCVKRALARNAPSGSSPVEVAQDKVKSLEGELAALDRQLVEATKINSKAEVEQLQGERKRVEVKITAAKADVERTKKDKKRCDDNPRAAGC